MSEATATATAPGRVVPIKPPTDLFYPMNEFYERAGKSRPDIVRVDGADVPEPSRSLLVHDRDMTPTLAAAYGKTMQLRILNRFLTDNVFAREIILEPEGGGAPVVFAAIKIYLQHFPAEAKRLVLEGKKPFGTILFEQGIVHASRPEAFIRVVADETINRALGLTGSAVLYGRRSALWNTPEIALAQVLEILPPAR